MERYDICVIGGGPAGYAAAMRGLDFGKKVILIEKKHLGGAGLHHGALSSKTFWELSQDIINAKREDRGFHTQGIILAYQEIVQIVQQAVREKRQQLIEQVEFLQKNAQAGSLRFVKGFASFITNKMIHIRKEQGEEEVIFAENVVIATGSRPRKLPDIPIDEEVIVTSDAIDTFDHFPKSLVILGAGVIGCEFATIFSNFGQTKVFLIDRAPRILPFEDEDIAEVVASNLEANGVVVHKGAKLKSMRRVDDEVEYVLTYDDGREEVHRVEKALISVGRVPNFEGLGIEKIGIQLNEKGAIQDTDTQTNISNIYAVGDTTADIALVNVAEIEGRHAVEKMYANPKPLIYENISAIMFLNPEVASVGVNEQTLQQKGIPYRVARMDYSLINRAIAMRRLQGFFKMIVTDDEEMKILGMRAMGQHASSTIQAVSLLIHLGKGISELAELTHPHPSITEGVQECARMLLGKSICKPAAFAGKLRCHRVVNNVCQLLYNY
ncbi:MAG: NAD(P)/FAD-dependent oxidoreductase [Bacteroidia bacterium]|nr:NAD(P)/FAD-dependent oxidoreductase [Bacteroidia bacterium]MDW8345711.1 NAD(P)/FAD-dependent oxidoreductase [Bacteroidia bacterium]